MSFSEKTAQNGNLVEEKFIVEYRKELYDITEFMLKHPGGVNTLNGYNRKNIEDKFKSVDHSPAAEYLLKDYKLKRQSDELNNNVFDDSMEVSVGVIKDQLKKFLLTLYELLQLSNCN